jgi:hypothetical protein
VGCRGKVAEQTKARELRAAGMTLLDIAREFGVAKSSVPLWVRDVEFTPGPRRRARRRAPNALQRRKQAEVLLEDGRRRIGELSEREFLVAGAALQRARATRAMAQWEWPARALASSRSFSRGSDGSSLLMSADVVSGCTCTKDWISTPPKRTGRAFCRSRGHSSVRPIGRYQTRASQARST